MTLQHVKFIDSWRVPGQMDSVLGKVPQLKSNGLKHSLVISENVFFFLFFFQLRKLFIPLGAQTLSSEEHAGIPTCRYLGIYFYV